MPRAAINFNDMVGGGDIIEGNVCAFTPNERDYLFTTVTSLNCSPPYLQLIFNSCRESGDHGRKFLPL